MDQKKPTLLVEGAVMGHFDLDSNITAGDFILWERVRASGKANMANVHYVSQLSGVSIEKCRYIFRNYSELKDKFSEAGNE